MWVAHLALALTAQKKDWGGAEPEKCRVNDSVIANMRSRVELCRRLAKSTTDKQTAKVLNDMADEVEADIARLRAEGFDH